MEQQKKHSVLVVDDQSSNIMALTHILSPEYTVYAVKNGVDAISAAEKQLPDVILLDVVMPEMDGFDVITKLKASETTKHIPVIFITGLTDVEDEKKGLALGGADYIGKPFSTAIVRLRVKNQIESKRQMRLIIDKELAEKSSRTAIEFLLKMNHEMLTPMNAIIGFTQMLKMPGQSEALKDDCVNEIEEASNRLLGLIRDLLGISGNDTPMLMLSEAEFSLEETLSTTLKEIAVKVAEKRQSLTSDIAADVPRILIGDGGRLSQVITNLLLNAVKFTPGRGKIHISVSLAGGADSDQSDSVTLQVEVTDTGVGIAKDMQGDIFSAFMRNDAAVDERGGGIGLGLAMSKRIVALMSGEIWVESEVGSGSKFVFTCKLRKR